MNTWYGRKKRCSRIASLSRIFLDRLWTWSGWKMTEEGENREGDRIGRWRRCGRNGGGTREHDEHIGKNGTNSNQVLSNSTSFSLLTILYLKNTKRRNEKSRRYEFSRMSGYSVRGSFLRGFHHDRWLKVIPSVCDEVVSCGVWLDWLDSLLTSIEVPVGGYRWDVGERVVCSSAGSKSKRNGSVENLRAEGDYFVVRQLPAFLFLGLELQENIQVTEVDGVLSMCSNKGHNPVIQPKPTLMPA